MIEQRVLQSIVKIGLLSIHKILNTSKVLMNTVWVVNLII